LTLEKSIGIFGTAAGYAQPKEIFRITLLTKEKVDPVAMVHPLFQWSLWA
jgi:hypothetical protein